MVTLQPTATTHKDVQEAKDAIASKTVIKMSPAAQIAIKSTALHTRIVKNIKNQNIKHVQHHILRLEKINQKTKIKREKK